MKTTPPPVVDTNYERLKHRLAFFERFHSEEPCQRQKSILQKQLESFLWSLPEIKSLKTATPQDIINFLIWRDKYGKTMVHLANCTRLLEKNGNHSQACNCPRNLAVGTVGNNIGKLRSIFKENGRGSYWNDDFQTGNPASHYSVKRYQTLVLEEQVVARTFPSLVFPIFLDKLSKLCSYLRDLIIAPQKSLLKDIAL